MEHKGFGYEQLLDTLASASPEQVQLLRANSRKVEHGLLSVGIKLHILDQLPGIEQFVAQLDSEHYGGGTRPYRRQDAIRCLILPPVGNATMAVSLLECIERTTKTDIFNNEVVQIQVCSPNRLEARHAALLSIGFYLASDVLQTYDLSDLETTFSESETWYMLRGKRITIFDGQGALDRGFDYWDLIDKNLVVRPELPFTTERTDVLTRTSKIDVLNVNLIATLLTHHERLAWWEYLGRDFVQDFEQLLDEHLLGHLLDAPWIVTDDEPSRDNTTFFLGLQELMSYASSEAQRLREKRRFWQRKQGPQGLLEEVRQLVRKYRVRLVRESKKLDDGEVA